MATSDSVETLSGVAPAVVTDNDDPEDDGRVRVSYPWQDGSEEYWARVATLMAGSGHGTYFLPDVEDEVLVAFETGDPTQPYVIGELWSDGSPPPDYDDPGNDIRSIVTAGGHEIEFDDSGGEETVTIETGGGRTIELSDESGSERIRIDDGANTIEMDETNGEVVIEAEEKLSLSAPTVEIDADAEVAVSAKGNVDIASDARTNVSSKGQLNLDSRGLMDIDAAGLLRIQGALIQLN